MKLDFNWANSGLTLAQQAIAEKRAETWARDNLDSGEYIVCDDATANALASDYITDSLWAFNASFLAGETGLDERRFHPIKEKLCEDANPAFAAMITGTCGLASFVQSAIQADGRGYFLASYNGDEHYVCVNVQRKRVGLYFYRTN
jgi:hypothetical protein